MTSVVEDFCHIARRLAEIRAERERHFGVILHPLPAVEAKAEPAGDDGDHVYAWT